MWYTGGYEYELILIAVSTYVFHLREDVSIVECSEDISLLGFVPFKYTLCKSYFKNEEKVYCHQDIAQLNFQLHVFGIF